MINFTEDPRINKHIAKLNLIEEELAKLPHSTDINEISVEHAIALDDRRQLKERIERESLAFGIKNPLQNATPSGNNDAMGTSSQHHISKDGQFPTEAAAAAERMEMTKPNGEAILAAERYQDQHYGYEKPFPETQVPQSDPVIRQPTSSLSASDNLRSHIKKWEKFVAKVYDDGEGNWTGGYGHVENNIGDGWYLGMPVSRAAGRQMFDQDIADAERTVKNLIPQMPDLSQREFDVLVDIAYSLGSPTFNLPRNSQKIKQALRNGNLEELKNQMIYSKTDNGRNSGLYNRSLSRKEIIHNGIYGRRYE